MGKAARVATSGLLISTLGYPARGPASWRRRSESSIITDSAVVGFTDTLHDSCAVQYSRPWLLPRTGTEIPEQLLPLSMWPLGRGGPSIAEKGGPNENACLNPAACGRSHGVSCACGFPKHDRQADCAGGWPVLRRSCVHRSGPRSRLAVQASWIWI